MSVRSPCGRPRTMMLRRRLSLSNNSPCNMASNAVSPWLEVAGTFPGPFVFLTTLFGFDAICAHERGDVIFPAIGVGSALVLFISATESVKVFNWSLITDRSLLIVVIFGIVVRSHNVGLIVCLPLPLRGRLV